MRSTGTVQLCMFLIISLVAALIKFDLDGNYVESVIQAPRKTIYNIVHDINDDDDDPVTDNPYKLSINEGDILDTLVDSSSHIRVNLNKDHNHPVYVKISLNDTRDMLSLDYLNDHLHNVTNTSVIVKYDAHEWGDKLVVFRTNDYPGYTKLVCQIMDNGSKDNAAKTAKGRIYIDDTLAFIMINIARTRPLIRLSELFGWTYFLAWSLSFYSQVILNFRRKSVIGLNFDFLALNIVGFSCYLIYNWMMISSLTIQDEYHQRYPLSRIPVEMNDLFFTIHAVCITLVTIIQCFIYERGDQRVSKLALSFITVSLSLGLVLLFVHLFGKLSALDIIIYLSYVKLVITLIKYMPQAYMNYRKKSTVGWSIHNILLDFIGGTLSIIQMFVLAYNYNDWLQIFGNLTKFGLGAFSISFDILFIIQHYFLYANPEHIEIEDHEAPAPVISQSIRDLNETHQNTDNKSKKSTNNDTNTTTAETPNATKNEPEPNN